MLPMRAFLPLLLLCSPLAALTLDLNQPEAAELQLEELVAEWESAWMEQPDAANGSALGSSLQALGIIERQLAKPKEARVHLLRDLC